LFDPALSALTTVLKSAPAKPERLPKVRICKRNRFEREPNAQAKSGGRSTSKKPEQFR